MNILESRAFQTQIPSAPRWLGLAGVLPFVWGAISAWSGELARPVADWLGTGFIGRGLQLTYGAVILSFMSGVLWGFACKAAQPKAPLLFSLSTLPALWAAFLLASAAPMQPILLIGGFVALFGLDIMFFRYRLTPDWWLKLRALLTALVLACLGIAA
ncbi:DUF3429 domain-containing protein [uncultured Planktomarina sp.]|jgi:hypothetical protein|uniref:DUF3429 domain-containing protein n=1 Tax=uncultured Planktomarina sp. TaxID=1538529 RepID=UPI003260E22E